MALALDTSQSLTSEIFAESPELSTFKTYEDNEKNIHTRLEIFNVCKTLVHFSFKLVCLILLR